MHHAVSKTLRSATVAAALAVGGAFALAPQAANAALFSSNSEINGVGAVDDLLPASGGSGTKASDATGIDFDNDSLIALVAAGDLAPLVGATGTIQDIAVGTIPLTGGSMLMIANFYTYTNGADSVIFDLGSIDSVARDPSGLTSLTISGSGTLRGTINGIIYDPTPASYELTVQDDGSTTFSSSTDVGGAIEVPEPATLGLFGLGLMGIAAATRRRRRAG
jgi:hypothetical protein